MTRRGFHWLWLPLLALDLATVSGSPRSAPAPRTTAVSAALLPAELNGRGQAILDERDDAKRAKLAASLAKEEPARAAAFLLAIVDDDSSPRVRREVLDELGVHPTDPIRIALERHATSDPDVGVSLTALERLRQHSAHELHQLLRRRLAAARAGGEAEAAKQLLAEDERWISIERGTMLPSFLRQPPALFEAVGGRSIRVLAFGDFGDGSEEQKRTAAAMRRAHGERPFDLGLTLGDNFYEEGMTGPSDPRWLAQWEELYGPLGIRFYPELGNHDWKLSDSPAAEILYSSRSASWRMPSPYYTFTAGPAQFFAIDTEEVSELQLSWLKQQLEASNARWKIVYGHHPVYSAGQHGDTKRLVEELLPILRHRADVYLCGHDHDMQHLRPDGGVQFFVAGAGGAHQRPIHDHPRTLFARTDVHGFATLEANETSLTVRFVSADSEELYSYTLQKPAGALGRSESRGEPPMTGRSSEVRRFPR